MAGGGWRLAGGAGGPGVGLAAALAWARPCLAAWWLALALAALRRWRWCGVRCGMLPECGVPRPVQDVCRRDRVLPRSPAAGGAAPPPSARAERACPPAPCSPLQKLQTLLEAASRPALPTEKLMRVSLLRGSYQRATADSELPPIAGMTSITE
jgi:hypothetical protein